MRRNVSDFVWLLVVLALAVAVGHSALAVDREVPPIIHDNALLKAIHKQNPTRALNLASEVEGILASVQRGEQRAKRDVTPRLRFRGAEGPSSPRQDDDVIRKNKKDFDENPALRNIYLHSPLASLRMLKRLREAAGKIKQ